MLEDFNHLGDRAMHKINSTAGFSLRSLAGFSIVELMVVVVILGGLASLAMPRLRQFIAASRQAEAKNLLAQIHTLQVTHQNSKDKFASWAKGATQVGRGGHCHITAGVGTCSGCTADNTKNGAGKTSGECTGTGCTWAATPGAFELGFKPQNCEELRYGYWVIQNVEATGANKGKEGYLAVAYAPSEDVARIYPTCNGKTSGRTIAMKHPFSNITTITSPAQGDWQTVNEDKVWAHDDIIEVCK